MSSMDILVACECSGEVRNAFLAKGHNALSCDLKATETDGPHCQEDVIPLLFVGWDMLIGFPPCTYLCSSGIHWTTRGHRDPELTREGAEFFLTLWDAPIDHICIENPVGIMSSVIGPPTQIIQPYEFGHDASKRTCLWLKGLPPLKPTKYVDPVFINGKPRWANQAPCGADKTSPGPERGAIRARTYSGVAAAMAEQWG